MPFRACVCSALFAWHVAWLSVMQLRHYLFIGTLNPLLQHLARGDTRLGTRMGGHGHGDTCQGTHDPGETQCGGWDMAVGTPAWVHTVGGSMVRGWGTWLWEHPSGYTQPWGGHKQGLGDMAGTPGAMP